MTDLWKVCFLYFLCNCNSSDYCHFTPLSLQNFFLSLQSFSREKNAYRYVCINAYICRYLCIQTHLFFPSNTSQVWKTDEISRPIDTKSHIFFLKSVDTSKEQKAKQIQSFLFLSCLIQTAGVFKLFNLLSQIWSSSIDLMVLWNKAWNKTSKQRCVVTSEDCFYFHRLYIIAGFSPISILVNSGEVRGSVYFNNWANQHRFSSKHRDSKLSIQHLPSTCQGWDLPRDAWGPCGSWLWAWDS